MEQSAAGDLVVLRRQARAAGRALLRPGTYLGLGREVALNLVHASTYPLGLLPGSSAAPVDLGSASSVGPGATPVILVHGWSHNRSAFLLLRRALQRAGFRNVGDLDAASLRCGIDTLAPTLAAAVNRALEATGADRCVLIAHSLGGLVARWYVQELGGDERVDAVVTLGTPHRGTYVSYLGVGRAAAQMRPGSTLLRRLAAGARPSAVRWLSIYSDLDLCVIPAVSAKLVHPVLAAQNVRVRDTGHGSLLLSPAVARAVLDWLLPPAVSRGPAARTPAAAASCRTRRNG